MTAGRSYSVAANIVHETKNVGTEGARRGFNAFVLDKGKSRDSGAIARTRTVGGANFYPVVGGFTGSVRSP